MANPRAVSVAIIFALDDSIAPSHDSSISATDAEPTFLLVSSRKRKNRYVFPKGGIEYGERPAEAAERESWEEAGLRQGTAKHLAHLLLLKDPSAHILSPTEDVDSASFVASCQYSFELFFLPPPPNPSPSAPSTPATGERDGGRIPNSSEATDSSASTVAPTNGHASSNHSRLPSSDLDPPPVPVSSLPEAYLSTYLSPDWPEASERDRILVRGWDALQQAVCWGRREDVMRTAIDEARKWIQEEWDPSAIPNGGGEA